MAWDSELEDFKRKIDLREYAAELGYTLDRRESWRGSAVMRNGADKVVIKLDGDGHYVFFSVRNEWVHRRFRPVPQAPEPGRGQEGAAPVDRSPPLSLAPLSQA